MKSKPSRSDKPKAKTKPVTRHSRPKAGSGLPGTRTNTVRKG